MLTIFMQLEYHRIIAGGLLMRQFDLFADKELDKGKVTMVTRTSIFYNSPGVCWRDSSTYLLDRSRAEASLQ